MNLCVPGNMRMHRLVRAAATEIGKVRQSGVLLLRYERIELGTETKQVGGGRGLGTQWCRPSMKARKLARKT